MKNKPVKIMWLGLRGFPDVQGGVETHAQHLCPQLAELGCEVTVIVRSPYQPANVGPEWRKVHFHSIWAPRSKSMEAIVHSFLGVLYAAIKRPDILHIQAIGPALVTPLARLFGLRVVVTHHGPDYDGRNGANWPVPPCGWGNIAACILPIAGLPFQM